MTEPHLKAQIAGEIYIAMERLGAGPGLLSIIGSWCDTLPDEQILAGGQQAHEDAAEECSLCRSPSSNFTRKAKAASGIGAREYGTCSMQSKNRQEPSK